jgi:hypothetical protein
VYMMPRAARALGIVSVVIAAGFLACTDLNQSPFVPVVTNVVDTFNFTVVATGATRTVRYMWTTTATAAEVDLASNITGGSASVTITDADNTQVFDHSLDGSGPTLTTAATAGDWLILMTLSNTTGTIHLTVKKP